MKSIFSAQPGKFQNVTSLYRNANKQMMFDAFRMQGFTGCELQSLLLLHRR